VIFQPVRGGASLGWLVVDQQALSEYRYRAVREVLGGSPIGEVAVRYGTSRQSLDAWRGRFAAEGMPGLADRSRRPLSSPGRVPAETEALICEMRRGHPRWGARRIVYELGLQSPGQVPGRATVHRVLAHNGWWPLRRKSISASISGGSARRRCSCGSWTWSAGCRWLMAAKPRWSPASMTIRGSW
jgi:transposase